MANNDSDFQLLSSVLYDRRQPWHATLEQPSNHALAGAGRVPEETSSYQAKESPIMLLPYHVRRLKQAAEAFDWPEAMRAMSVVSRAEIELLETVEAGVAQVESMKGDHQDKSDVSDSSVPVAFKIRCLLAKNGALSAQVFPIAPIERDPLELADVFELSKLEDYLQQRDIIDVVLDTQPTVTSLFTENKTTRRNLYDQARTRAGITSANSARREVLLWNQDGEVMEGSVRSLYVLGRVHGTTGSNSMPDADSEQAASSSKGIWKTPPLTTGCLNGSVRMWMLETGRAQEEVIQLAYLQDGQMVLLSNGVEGCTLGQIRLAQEKARE